MHQKRVIDHCTKWDMFRENSTKNMKKLTVVNNRRRKKFHLNHFSSRRGIRSRVKLFHRQIQRWSKQRIKIPKESEVVSVFQRSFWRLCSYLIFSTCSSHVWLSSYVYSSFENRYWNINHKWLAPSSFVTLAIKRLH